MSLQITRGKKPGAVRAVIYGVEGIGKSTLASQIPDSLIIDTEDGSGQIDTARVIALDWRAIEHAVKELALDSQGFKAVIIDTADWLEKALIEHMLKQSGKKSIEDYGYGKGYTILQEHVVRFLGEIDKLIAQGIHVVFVAHATCKRTSPPDQTDGYDRYELKLTKQVAPIFKEWADVVLFCNYKIQIVEGSDGKLKAQGGKERVMHAAHSAAWDAKNRYGLPDEMPMEFKTLASVFAVAAPRFPAKAEKGATEAALKADLTLKESRPLNTLATKQQIAEIELLKKTHGQLALDCIEAAMEPINAVGLDELTTEQADTLIKTIVAGKITKTEKTGPALPPNVKEWLTNNEDTANDYLRHVGWLTNAQTWRDLDTDNSHSLVDRFDKFKGAALNHAKAAKKAA